MERYKKKDILQTAAALIKANHAIKKVIKTNPAGVLETLSACQESAIVIGTYIETLGEKYSYLVRILEDYCENIYKLSISLANENLCRMLIKKVHNQLEQLNKGIYNNIPEDRREVAFLPYKASMWDSLESVWKAADDDEDTDAYVIPIPYFEKKPDGSFGQVHYEGDLYPGYVPITNYDDYNFEERRPDIIFVHNPYDENNKVTSVHPFFYSRNLKNFTEKLVYIPYFILNEINPDDKGRIEKIKDLIITSTALNADKIFVQSEEMRQLYINILSDATGNTKEVRERWENKISGIGSPKLDKISNTNMENVEVPKNWEKVINKPDGTAKKIILYNNSINALLESNEDKLKKMESVFLHFKECRDEIALLWRPHPLIENTLKSMRPHLWDAYRKIRDNYLEEGWGIYDESPDIDRAVTICDAYYGDPSSVVQLCEKKNKPIMIQNDQRNIS